MGLGGRLWRTYHLAIFLSVSIGVVETQAEKAEVRIRTPIFRSACPHFKFGFEYVLYLGQISVLFVSAPRCLKHTNHFFFKYGRNLRLGGWGGKINV